MTRKTSPLKLQLERCLILLKALPNADSKNKYSTGDILQHLNDLGYPISLRTMQRTLNTLHCAYYVDFEEQNGKRYWFRDDTSFIPDLGCVF